MSTLDDIKATFFVECQELLEDMEAGLIEMSEGAHDAETVNAVFRAAHSIKGGAGAFAFNDLVSFAHRFETTLDEVRSNRLAPSADVMNVFLRAADQLADLVQAAQEERDVDVADIEGLLNDLAALTGDTHDANAATEEFDDGGFEPMGLDFGDLGTEDETSSGTVFSVTFTPHEALLTRGNEPALLFRALASLGDIQNSIEASSIGTLDNDISDLSPSWNITLSGECDEASIREVFEFVEEDCDLSISSEASSSELFSEGLTDLPQEDGQASDDSEAGLVNPANDEPDNEANVIAIQTTSKTDPPSVSAAAEKAAPSSPPPSKAETNSRGVGSIRVDLDRVDRLINLVGELVVNQAMLSQSVVDAGLVASSSVATGLDEFKNLTREVQDSVMAIRAQPVRSLFQRMSRIVREAASATGKSVKLRTEGEATEIDKTVIDLLADPLTHMIRNAIDHGLEAPADREAAGKPTEGSVKLTAAHRSGRVVIEIADDGAGINRERVFEIAASKGLVAPDATLPPSDIDNLLFLPGFSTAKEVSNLSGRGVGMDVVKQAIQKLGGRIAISSEPGKGSVFSISLPLTLAVLDGMIVRVDDQTLVVPLTSIVETIRPEPGNIKKLGRDGRVIRVRDSYVPILDIGQKLGFSQGDICPERDVLLLIEGEQSGQRALALDVIIEQRQVVIKSLEDNYGHVDGVAAATILGNGRIALILDPDALIPSRTPTSQSPEAAQ